MVIWSIERDVLLACGELAKRTEGVVHGNLDAVVRSVVEG